MVLIVRNAVDIWWWSTVWQRKNQPKCVLGETNKETRKYKYGAITSKLRNMFSACVGFPLLGASWVRHRRMQGCAVASPSFFFTTPTRTDKELTAWNVFLNPAAVAGGGVGGGGGGGAVEHRQIRHLFLGITSTLDMQSVIPCIPSVSRYRHLLVFFSFSLCAHCYVWPSIELTVLHKDGVINNCLG